MQGGAYMFIMFVMFYYVLYVFIMFYLTLIFYIKYILYMCIRLLGHIQQYIIEHTNRQAYQFPFLIGSGHFLNCSPFPDLVCHGLYNFRQCPSQNRIQKLDGCLLFVHIFIYIVFIAMRLRPERPWSAAIQLRPV